LQGAALRRTDRTFSDHEAGFARRTREARFEDAGRMQDDKISEWAVMAAAALTALISLEGIALYGMYSELGADRGPVSAATDTAARLLYARAH
jgi:hypothetical protein